MNARRPPAQPPDLPGFEYLELLGSGGFADVYLYQQALPRRRVAIKVLLPDRIAGSASQFAAEANVMAMLSTHPAIVTIHQAGIADDGRPYLVMEYCPRPNLQARYRREPFSLAEALRVGIPVAAAVETAHRAGVLHRDIKPANILVTEYNRPALTDFGIASTSHAAAPDAAGLSIPWSPPEAFADVPQSGPRSDVYQLAATLYTLLAGRSPFEIPGERNASAELIDRIERMPLPDIGRPDVPASLIEVLRRAMAKDPAARFPSAVTFARALQKVQIELAHSVTPIDILDDAPVEEDDPDEDGGLTRVRGVTSIAPDATRPSAATARVVPQDDDATVRRGPTPIAPESPSGVDDATILRGGAPAVPPAAHTPAAEGFPQPQYAAPGAHGGPGQPPGQPPHHGTPPGPGTPTGPGTPGERPRPKWPWIVAASVVVAAIAVIAGLSIPALLGGSPEPDPAPTSADPVPPPSTTVVPKVRGLSGTVEGERVVFTWENPSPKEGDRYLWGLARAGGETQLKPVNKPRVSVKAQSGRTCIEVTLRRENGRSSEPAVGCVE